MRLRVGLNRGQTFGCVDDHVARSARGQDLQRTRGGITLQTVLRRRLAGTVPSHTFSKVCFKRLANVVIEIACLVACERMPTTGLLLKFTRRKHARKANARDAKEHKAEILTKKGANTIQTSITGAVTGPGSSGQMGDRTDLRSEKSIAPECSRPYKESSQESCTSEARISK